MSAYGGFDHNSHGLRIVTALERRYAEFDGLNLTFETVEGLVKHNGPLIDDSGAAKDRWAKHGVPAAILTYDRRRSLELSYYASLEAQVAAIADDIAYNAHDSDDGLRAALFDLSAIRQVPFIAALLAEIDRLYPSLEPTRVIHELGRRLVTRFIEDAIGESRSRLRDAAPRSIEDVRRASRPMIGFSAEFAPAQEEIKTFLFAHMYRHPAVARVREKADAVVRRLFEGLRGDPSRMPEEWAAEARTARMVQGEAGEAQIVADYIAGMTDRYAIAEHRRLFGEAPDLR
jgi:dGTPase